MDQIGSAGQLFTTVDLTAKCNSSAQALGVPADAGEQELRGIPFLLASSADGSAGLITLGPGDAIDIPIHGPAAQLILAHRLLESEILAGGVHGQRCGQVVLTYEDGETLVQPLRERFEISAVPAPNLLVPFCAWADTEIALTPREYGRFADVGDRIAEVDLLPARAFYLFPLANPRPDVALTNFQISAEGRQICLGAVTLAHTAEPVFPRSARRLLTFAFRETLTRDQLELLQLKVRRGAAGYVEPLEPESAEEFLSGPLPGWGTALAERHTGAYCYLSASPTAEMELTLGDRSLGEFTWKDLTTREVTELADGVSVTLDSTPVTWVRTSVVDQESGRPLHCRIHFRSLAGQPLQPHTHRNHIGIGLGERDRLVGLSLPPQDDVAMGGTSYAYIRGHCEGWLPEADILVDVAAGFDFEPVRTRISIEPGQQELTLELRRRRNLRARRFFSGDTHTHCLSTPLAHLHAAAEDLDVVNVLAFPFAHGYDGFGELRGTPDTAPESGTVVSYGQENMAQALGHLVLLNSSTPILPAATGGPYEGELGGPMETTLSRWADDCHAHGGTVIGAHHTTPNGELAVLAATGRLDALEWMYFQPHPHLDYYRYLDAGHQIPLVMATDRFAFDKPIGVNRTYVRIPDDVPFNYENWLRYLREGRTFVSNGPAVDLVVDGARPGDTVALDAARGSVDISATAEGPMPVERLEIVVNGAVAAETTRTSADGSLTLQHRAEIDQDSWIVARCGGDPYFSGLAHLYRGRHHLLGAHTSPIYVALDGPWMRAERSALNHHLALVEGGLTYLRSVAAQWPDQLVHHRHGQSSHQEYLEEPFHAALAELRRRLQEA
jgi:hypothetical protein